MEIEQVVAAVVALSPEHKVATKVRFQKAFYLLQALELIEGLEFEYHHFGPYSSELDFAVRDAVAEGLLVEKQERRVSDGASYSVFEAPAGVDHATRVPPDVALRMAEFSSTPVVVLELAATMHFLATAEGRADWLDELRKRKPRKSTPDRLQSAEDLLRRLGLHPSLAS